jgi:hypothetical protein
MDEAKQQYISACKARQVSADDAMIRAYLHSGNALDLKFLCGLMDRVPDKQDRIMLHNMYVAMGMGQDFLEIYGNRVLDLRWPMFPPHVELYELNVKLVTECPTEGGSVNRVPSVFCQPTARREPEGGELATIVEYEQGKYATDVTPIADSVRQIYQRIAQLEEAHRASQAELNSPRTQPTHNGGRWSSNGNNNGNWVGYGHGNNGNWGGYGNRGGRGRGGQGNGRGRGTRGGGDSGAVGNF